MRKNQKSKRLAIAVTLLLFVSASLLAQEKPLVSVASDWVIAKGKWSGKGVERELPVQHAVEIQCDRVRRFCVEVEASVLVSHGDPYVAMDFYEIAAWNKDKMVAKDDSAICVSNQIIVDFKDNNVTLITSKKPGLEGYKGCDPVEKGTRTYRLIFSNSFPLR